MRFDVLTIFPEMFASPLEASILGKAREKGLLEIGLHDIREHARGRHRSVDDDPYGGGGGMVMMAEPLVACIEQVREQCRPERLIVMSPQGRPFTPAGFRVIHPGGAVCPDCFAVLLRDTEHLRIFLFRRVDFQSVLLKTRWGLQGPRGRARRPILRKRPACFCLSHPGAAPGALPAMTGMSSVYGKLCCHCPRALSGWGRRPAGP